MKCCIRNKDYTQTQRLRDRAVYGRRAERRTNARMNRGYGIQGARNMEANRIHSARKSAVYAQKAGMLVGGHKLSKIAHKRFYDGGVGLTGQNSSWLKCCWSNARKGTICRRGHECIWLWR